MDVEPLAFIGQDEAVFLLLVEPQHLPLHSGQPFFEVDACKKERCAHMARASLLRVLSQLNDVLRLGTLGAFGGFELDLRTLGQ